MLKDSDDCVDKGVSNNLLSNNLLSNNLLSDNLLGDNNPAHIDSNINMDTKAKSNLNKDMIGNNLLEENSGINVENLFQQVQDQTTYKRLIRDI